MKRKQFQWNRLFAYLLIALSVINIHMPVSAAVIQSSGGEKARVIMENFKITNDMVVPGEDFDLSFKLCNPSLASSVYSVVLTFTNDNDLVTPVYGQPDKIYIDAIPAGGTTNASVKLHAADIVTTSSIRFVMKITYADSESSNNSDEMSIQLPVTTKSKLVIQNVSFPEDINAGVKTRMRIKYKNAGVDDLYNITMNIKSADSRNIQQVSLGSLIAGKVSYAETYVDFKKIGEQSAKITFTYEDVEGNKNTTNPYEATFTVLDSSSEESIETLHEEGADGNGSKYSVKLSLIIAIIAMGGIVWKLWNQYKK